MPDAIMLNHDEPYKFSSSCFITHIYIDTWNHSLSCRVRNASRQLANCISYHTEAPDYEYQIFSSIMNEYWMIGVGAGIPHALRLQYPELVVSSRLIEKRHCTDNIALIVEHELGKMPIVISNRHFV